MADQPLLSQHTASEPIANLTGDLPSGRQLRKSCRFCRSRKIRCTGETDIGCLACRNRNQKCVYEPTAAMGRPRKYPRTEYCEDPNAPLPMNLNSHPSSHFFEGGWNHSTLFMRTLQPHEYEQGPSGSFDSAVWRPLDEENRSAPFHFNPSVNMLRNRPFMPTLGGLPIPLNHQKILSNQIPRGNDGTFLNRILCSPSPAASLGNSMNFHHASTNPTEFPCDEARFQHSACSSRRISFEQNQMAYNSMDSAGARSPPLVLSHGPNALVNTHQIISTCDAGQIFQHFKGTTLHVTTQAHLEFILREYPNRYAPALAPPHKHPSVLEPKLYHTMLADVISWIVCAQASVSDRQDSSFSTQEPLFLQMLEYDRGENSHQDLPIIGAEGGLNPLIQLSYQELNSIYSQWLRANPFAFLFNDAAPSQHCIHLTENSAFLATVVGWHFYLSSRSRNYGSPQTPDNYPHMSPRCHMPFFEYAEAQLMGRAMCVNRSTLSIVQGLILLGAFRSVDSQPRCGWALLSVAHLLSKEYLSPAKRLKRPRNLNGELDVEENKILGINWLMWKVYAMIDGSPSYLEAFLNHARVNDSTTQTEWANRSLLNSSQILEVFCTLCQEDPSNSLVPDPMAKPSSSDLLYENKVYLIRWLMDTAKMRCQVMGSYDSPPSNPGRWTSSNRHDVRNAHANIVLAVVFSIFALSRLVPLEEMTLTTFTRIPLPIFRDVLKLLQIISVEGADSIVANTASLDQSSRLGEALLLRILRGLFPCFMILAQAFSNTLPEFVNASTADSNHITNQLIDVVESLGRFASAGLSLYPIDDFQIMEDIRIKMVSLSVSVSSQTNSSQESSGAFQPPASVSFLEPAQGFVKLQPRDPIGPEPFGNRDHPVITQRPSIPINYYPSESDNMIDRDSTPTKGASVEAFFPSNNCAQPPYQMTSNDVGGVLSSPPLSDPPSSTSYPFQSNHDPETKSENLLIPSQGTGLLLSLSDSQGLIEPSEMSATDLNPGVFTCPRGADQYFCTLDSDSSWVNQPPLHQIDLDSHSQPQALDSFPRTRTPNQLSPPAGSPPSYRLHSPCLDYFPNQSELREGSMASFLLSDSTNRALEAPQLTEHSSGFHYDALTRHGVSGTSTPARQAR
ncbi:hypothetical protein PGT21_021036 [Puccinia graminis f. sp. tritici]|uniref:Zn(2)-C6 fungal-type domain-containing protein n=1 Tax=Puccinia graminis f. sp. tritici TaxID=56615 RepID=A0A5B0LQF7_PUCGR|nr:hypothetical protein PGT21_021036 [Puccinia graminis f. sp. tritici]